MKWISGRVILAAAKLALIYGVMVLVGFALFFTLSARGQRVTLADLAGALLVLAIPLGVAFLLLAIARRAGFVAFWTILLVFWGFVVSEGLRMPDVIPVDFMGWSMLALPLWIIGHAGVRDPSSRRLRIGRLELSPTTIVLSCWLLLLAGTRFPRIWTTDIVIVDAPRWPSLVVWTLWAPAPLWISAFAVRHVWRGTAAIHAADSVSAA
jgi:hypothetical protein